MLTNFLIVNYLKKVFPQATRKVLLLWIIISLLHGCNRNERNQVDETFNPNGLIANAFFESPINFDAISSIWQKYSWQASVAGFEWIEEGGYKGSNCISLSSNNGDNDLALMQDIQLEEGKVYRFSAQVKTENVAGGRGANICLFGTWQSSAPLLDTNNWRQVSMVFIAPESGEVTIACRLGFYGGTATGKAWFDNLEIKEVEMFNRQSQHFRIVLKIEDASAVAAGSITTWLGNLDKAYEKYYELLGQYPFEGKTITIFSTNTYPGGWAVAGNPILWHQPYVKPTLLNVENQGDWSFGILHEIGHDFAAGIGIEGNTNWNWNEEMFANFRMYYAVELLDASVIQEKLYSGGELKNYYKTDSSDSYENKICKGETEDAHDGVMYTLIRIKDEIGWEPFKQTFRYLYETDTGFSGNWQRFSFFLDKLSEYSGINVRQIYPEGELDTIKEIMDVSDE